MIIVKRRLPDCIYISNPNDEIKNNKEEIYEKLEGLNMYTYWRYQNILMLNNLEEDAFATASHHDCLMGLYLLMRFKKNDNN